MELYNDVVADSAQKVSIFVDASCQTDIEMLWEYIDTLKKEGDGYRPKRKRGRPPKLAEITAGDIQVEEGPVVLHFLEIPDDEPTGIPADDSPDNVNALEPFGDTGGDVSDADYRPPKKNRGRPPGSARKKKRHPFHSGRGKNLQVVQEQAKQLLVEYLTRRGCPTDIYNYTKRELSEILIAVYNEWFNEHHLSATLIRSYASALRRLFLSEGAGPTEKLDIKSDPEFEIANSTLKAALEVADMLKASGMNKSHLTFRDIITIYLSGVVRTDTPEGLLNKVIFETVLLVKDLQLSELNTLTLGHIERLRDEQDREFYQFQGSRYRVVKSESPYCPFGTMEKFLSKHPKEATSKKWQSQTRLFLLPDPDFQNEDDAIYWYSFSPVGKIPLRTFMERISDCVGLSQKYTNIDLRTTPVDTWQMALNAISEETGGVITVTPSVESAPSPVAEDLILDECEHECDLMTEVSLTVDASGEISVTMPC